eukprot:Rmarinus@m.24273
MGARTPSMTRSATQPSATPSTAHCGKLPLSKSTPARSLRSSPPSSRVTLNGRPLTSRSRTWPTSRTRVSSATSSRSAPSAMRRATLCPRPWSTARMTAYSTAPMWPLRACGTWTGALRRAKKILLPSREKRSEAGGGGRRGF